MTVRAVPAILFHVEKIVIKDPCLPLSSATEEKLKLDKGKYEEEIE